MLKGSATEAAAVNPSNCYRGLLVCIYLFVSFNDRMVTRRPRGVPARLLDVLRRFQRALTAKITPSARSTVSLTCKL